MDAAHRATDKELERIEKKLAEIYSRAEGEIGETWKKYLAEQDAKIKDLQDVYDAAKKSGDKTATRKAGRTLAGVKKERTIMDSHYRRMTEKLARDISSVNEKAIAYVNGRLPMVYATNYNGFSKGLENEQMGISFELVDESTVRNLAMTDNTLLPYKKVNGKKDVRWNVQRLNAEVMQGILQGEPMDKIASRLSNVLGMNESSAIRNARTTVTSAENKGRLDMLHEAREKGVIAHKVWLAAHDSRTREAHAELDGEEAEIDDPFVNSVGEIMFPGDVDAEPANVYNCRCTLTYKVIGFDRKGSDVNEEYFGDEHKEEREIYGVEDSMTYVTSRNGEVDIKYYAREQEEGKWVTKRGIDSTIKISDNPSKTEVIVQTVKKPSGFMRTDETQNAILTNGRIAVNYDTGNNSTRARIRSMIENEIDILGGVRENGVFYRVTGNPKDQQYILSGKIRPSVNHMTGQKEDGLSVWERPKYFGEYLEKVFGEVVGIGSDGEPLLDVKTVKLISVNEDNITEMREFGKKRFLEVYGWTEEQLKKALEGRYKIMR